MKGFKEIFEQVQALFGTNDSMPISGSWVKWCHEGIPDGPKEVRDTVRKFATTQGHCLECTALSGCSFRNWATTVPTYSHHPKCHCEKQNKGPNTVTAEGQLNPQYGQFININIELESPKHGTINLISGWRVHPDGLLTCNTPLGDR